MRKRNKNFVSLSFSKKGFNPKRNRNVGHNYEREWAQTFRSIGYDKCKTTRQVSRLLDSCKVDLAFIPFNFQCKRVASSIKYQEIFNDIKRLLNENYPKDDPQVSYPAIIAHKRNKDEEFIIMEPDTFIKIATELFKIKEEKIKNE